MTLTHPVITGWMPVSLIAIALVVAGCAPTPTREEPVDPIAAEMAAIETSADPAVNGRLLRNQAASVTGERRVRYLIRAAELLARGGQFDETRETLELLDLETVPPDIRLRRDLLAAELDMDDGDPEPALALALPAGIQLPTDAGVRYHRLRARAFRSQGNLLESVNERILLDTLLADRAEMEANQTALLATLTLVSVPALEQLSASAGPPLNGWMELAVVIKRNGEELAALSRELDAWRLAHPDHPLILKLSPTAMAAIAPRWEIPEKVAVLLPESGKYQRAAATIREGILAAWFRQPVASRPEIRFYDSADLKAVWPAYHQAISEGAQFVIGPLTKSAIGALAKSGDLRIPILALNYLPDDVTTSHTNFIQFGLSPEQEAEQAAERAVADSRTQVAMLLPTGQRGDRIGAAFEQRLAGFGGVIPESQRFTSRDQEYSGLIARLLNLDESNARYAALKRLLGQRMEFEPRRRQDVDAVFLSAKPGEARLIRPLLQFHRAADIDIYATSQIHEPDSYPDRDLEGILFTDMPWLLGINADDRLDHDTFNRLWPNRSPTEQRLFAMGMDAWDLVQQLPLLAGDRRTSYTGYTGNLWLLPDGRVHRQLAWARFLGGNPQVMGYTPRMRPLTQTNAPEVAAEPQ